MAPTFGTDVSSLPPMGERFAFGRPGSETLAPTFGTDVSSLPPKGERFAFGRPGGETSNFIYLASQSPRRSQLLDQLGIEHRLLLADEGEDSESLEVMLPNEAPRRYVQRVTSLKLRAALERLKSRRLPDAPVLCADTTVALGRAMYGKPVDAQDACRMLQELSGHTHQVLTAVAIGWGDRKVVALSVSRVRFAAVGREAIEAYVASGEPMGKAGAYAVQGGAATFIAHISGSYTGIMGLPLFETAQALQEIGFTPCSKIS